MSERKRKFDTDEVDKVVEQDIVSEPFQVKPKELLNIYKESDRKSPIISCISIREIGTVNQKKNGLGYVIEKKGWVNLSKVEIL